MFPELKLIHMILIIVSWGHITDIILMQVKAEAFTVACDLCFLRIFLFWVCISRKSLSRFSVLIVFLFCILARQHII